MRLEKQPQSFMTSSESSREKKEATEKKRERTQRWDTETLREMKKPREPYRYIPNTSELRKERVQ